MSYFEYRSLTPYQARIRLITVLPEEHHRLAERNSVTQNHAAHDISESRSCVSCTLTHVSLDTAPTYTALSYSWGDASQKREILVNGATVMVTVNLEAALRQLRLRDGPRTLWIDALCIDQSDEVEKSEQLEQMRRIYSQAGSVLAWLGPAVDESDLALRWIRQYGRRSSELGIGTKAELRLRYLLEATEANGKGLVDESLKGFVEDLKEDLSPTSLEHVDLITALSKLFKRPYWSRIWIVQELRTASSVLFVCGGETVTDDYLNHAIRLLRNFGQYQFLKWDHNTPIPRSPAGAGVDSIDTVNPINLLKFRRAVTPSPLIHLMRSFRRFQATNPRDKLFALLGIATDTNALGLHPDYTKSCQEVYTNLARTLIRNGYIELLSLCESPKEINGLPSWVHDWSAKSYRSPLQQRSLDRSARPIRTFLEPGFSASRTHKMVSLENEQHTSDWKRPLLLRGTCLGEVRQVGTNWEEKAVGQWLLDLQRLSKLIPDTSQLSGGRAHAVWRTAVADQEIRQGIRKPRLSEEKIRAVHESLKSVDIDLVDAQTLTGAGLSEYCEQLQTVARGRRPLFTGSEYLGIGPRETELGDLVYVLLGADTPYILRRRSQDATLQLIGEAYVHGVMDGEAMEGSPLIEEIALS